MVKRWSLTIRLQLKVILYAPSVKATETGKKHVEIMWKKCSLWNVVENYRFDCVIYDSKRR